MIGCKDMYRIMAYFYKIEQIEMTFDHDFGYSFPFFSSLLLKEVSGKGEWIAKIFLLDLL